MAFDYHTFHAPEAFFPAIAMFLYRPFLGGVPTTPDPKGLDVCYCLWGCHPDPRLGSDPGPVQVPSQVRRGPVQIRHVLYFTPFRTHPGPEVGAIPAPPDPILVPSVPSRIGPGRAETDFLATSDPDPKKYRDTNGRLIVIQIGGIYYFFKRRA